MSLTFRGRHDGGWQRRASAEEDGKAVKWKCDVSGRREDRTAARRYRECDGGGWTVEQKGDKIQVVSHVVGPNGAFVCETERKRVTDRN